MEIYLLRHGIAEDAAAGQPDSERSLTKEGRRKLRAVLETIANNAAVTPELIITSPYRRAVQTAELAADVFGYTGDMLRANALTPDSQPREVWDEIRLHRDVGSMLLAGHEPLFSTLTAYLLGCPDMQVDFRKGAVVRIDVERFVAEPRGVLRWMLTAKLCREGR